MLAGVIARSWRSQCSSLHRPCRYPYFVYDSLGLGEIKFIGLYFCWLRYRFAFQELNSESKSKVVALQTLIDLAGNSTASVI
jgi:hypothetical protein